MAVGRAPTDPPVPKIVGDWPPVEGFYKARRVKGGPWQAVRIWFGPPADPWDGSPLDRAPRWQALWGGRLLSGQEEISRIWPYCGQHPIWPQDYEYMEALREHAVHHETLLPQAAPQQAIDWSRVPPPQWRRA